MRKLLVFGVLSAMLAMTGVANAVPIQLREAGVTSAAVVNATFPEIGTWNVLAGFYRLEIEKVGTFDGFCVDPAWASSSFSEYDLRSIDEGSSYERAAYLLSLGSAAGFNAAAAQVAVWEIIFESAYSKTSPTYSLTGTTGVFTLNAYNQTLNPTLLSDAEGYLQRALSLTQADLLAFDQSGFSLAVSPTMDPTLGKGFQDYIVNTPAPVPEPSTLMLLGSGLSGLGVWQFYRRKPRRKV